MSHNLNFYTEEEKKQRIAYVPKIRASILESLEDLKQKIKDNEPCPEQEQNIDMLVEIHDNIDECLNNWYY